MHSGYSNLLALATFLGISSGHNNTIGAKNIFIGGRVNTNGQDNVFPGYVAGYKIQQPIQISL